MINMPRSPLRFILFLAVMGLLLVFVAVKWGDFQMETLGQATIPDVDVVVPQPTILLPTPIAQTNDETVTAVVSERPVGDLFAAQRVLRERSRSAQLDLLQKMAKETDVESSIREQAEQALLSLSERATREAEIEAIVLARGFADALVYLYDETAVIVVPATEMDGVTAGQLADAVVRVANIPYAGISIMVEPE